MMTGLRILLAVMLALLPTASVWAQSGGNCSIYRSWITGDSLTAGDLSTSMTTVGVTNMTQACIDGISDTVAGMQTTTDPYASQTESLATSGAGEIQRLRFTIGRMFGLTYWYRHDENVNFAHAGGGTNVQGSGTGRHVTAVGYHSWGGSQRFPAITGGYRHTTGLWWPAAHHFAISVDPANDADKAGVEMVRVHAGGVILHHTAALRFRHSLGNSPSTGHITAIQVSRGLASAAGNEAAGRDTLLFGHSGAVMNLVGYGASHIALGAGGSGSYVALGRHTLTGMTPVVGALYGDSIVKAFAYFNGGTADTPVSAGFNVAGVTDVETGRWVVRWIQPFSTANYVVVTTGGGNCGTVLEDLSTAHVNVRAFTYGTGVACDPGFVSVIAIGAQ